MRNALIALAAAALADSVAVALRQLGIVKRLPDVPWRGFDANAVTTSPAAYPLGVPDATLAIGAYATEIVAAAGWRRLLMLAVAGGTAGAAYYLWQMAAVEKRACLYCLGAIAASFAMVPLTVKQLSAA
jgi:uncharacterized membrane protein